MDDKTSKACDMLSAALEMEDKGKDFYQKAAETCKLQECKDIFERLAEDEVKHKERIETLHKSLTGGEGWCEWLEDNPPKDDLDKMMKQATSRHGQSIKADSGDIEALEVALDMEARGLKFYKQHLDQAEEGVEKEFLERMVAEERSHYQTLADMKFYLEDPAGWFREQERHGMDGA